LSFILWEYLKYSQINKSYQYIGYKIPLIFLILIFSQIAIGAFVAGMDAGKIYNTWPLMGSAYFPDDNLFLNIFSLSAFSDPSLVQFMHRNLAYLIFLYYLFVFFYIYKKKYIIFFKAINVLGIILIIQMMLGILTLILGAQIILSSMHQISTIFLVSQCVYLHFLNFNQQL
tara:strand:- start:18 stop:533 length:516 start_codon:yes stop_codon:yes gene_type:complete